LVDFLFGSSAQKKKKLHGVKQDFVEAILSVLDAKYTDQENGL